MDSKDWLNRNLFLKFDQDDNQIWIQSTYTLRKLIGILGMCLPLLLCGFLYLSSGDTAVLPSISHYFFTKVDSIFLIIIGAIALFLTIYKGKEPIDFFVSLIAGVFAIMLLCFPTEALTSTYPDSEYPFFNKVWGKSSFRETFHYISAGIFLSSLAFMSLFLFTKSNLSREKQGRMKRVRNTIYIVCGIIMILAMGVILGREIGLINKDFYDRNNLTFWMESVAVEAFGFSWLVKGESLFKDKPPRA